MNFRPYDREKDREAVQRIYREVGWLQEGENEELDAFLEAGKTLVADLEGSAECAVVMLPGTIRYLEEDLSFAIVGAVTTSRIARKQGLAGRLTALAIADDAADGALVSGLGMFEQGYYDKLGFGTGPYQHWPAFDPADLLVNVKARIPRRISADDWEAVHASRLAQLRGHGGCTVTSPKETRAEMIADKKAFGLGYFDGEELTHHVWINPEKVEPGPYTVKWMAYRNGDQLLELLALLRSLGDQVHLIELHEPPEIQLQDLLRRPLTNRLASKKSEFQNQVQADAYWQLRILDLPGCMARTHLPYGEVRFNLRLDDPIGSLLDDSAPWHGITGDYVVTLGSESSARLGTDSSLPTLTASVGAFTRMWMGVRPASGLAVTDSLSGPADLLSSLDHALLLPEPHLGWEI